MEDVPGITLESCVGIDPVDRKCKLEVSSGHTFLQADMSPEATISKMKFRIKDEVEGGREEATFFVSEGESEKKTYLLLDVAPCSYSAEHLWKLNI